MLILNQINRHVKKTSVLPGSKSESNRVLIIQALTQKRFDIKNISDSADTQTLRSLLEKQHSKIVFDVGHAGTTMRFLTAYFAVLEGERILTGSDRMKQRPIGTLVCALQELGAEITYLEKEGFPPLKIKGTTLTKSQITIDGSVSSQFISALLMIAPTLKHGLSINLAEPIVSKSYLQMTLKMMHYFGIDYTWVNNCITIPPQTYLPKNITIEADWSSASYFYELAAFSTSAEITLIGLKNNSLQGDWIIQEIFSQFGVETRFQNENFILKKIENFTPNNTFDYDFTNCPDLTQTLAVTCAGLGIQAKLTGLKTLRIKETDRLQALKTELEKIGCRVTIETNDTLILEPSPMFPNEVSISTYNDHRMAMAFAPLMLKIKSVFIENPNVVDKSFPHFWEQLFD